MHKFRVIVGKVGTAYAGNNFMQAVCKYSVCVKASKMLDNAPYSGEGVILLHNGKIKREYVGNSGKSEDRIEVKP